MNVRHFVRMSLLVSRKTYFVLTPELFQTSEINDCMSHPKISTNVIFIRFSQRYRKVLFHMRACFYCTVAFIPCGGSISRYSTETDVVSHQRWLESLTGAMWREDFWFHLNEKKGKQKSVYILKWFSHGMRESEALRGLESSTAWR